MNPFPKNPGPILLFFIMLLSGIVHGIDGNAQQVEAVGELKQLIEHFRFDDAIRRADHFLLADSANHELLMLKSKALSSLCRYKEANLTLSRMVKTDTSAVPAWFEMINNYRQLGNIEQAVNCCKRIIELRPENCYFKLQLAGLYYNQEDYTSALEILEPLRLSDTTSLYLNRQIANCYHELKVADSAILYFSRTLMLDPEDVSSISKLISLYLKKKEFPVALGVALGYLRTDSLNPAIHRLTGYCYYLLKDYETAENYFLKSLEAGDDSRFLLKYLGLCYYKTERYALAEPRFRKAFSMDTTDAEVCFYCGVSAGRSMLLDSGLIMLNKTLNLLLPSDDFLASLYAELASVYNQMDRSDTALSLLLRSRETSPANPASSFKIAYQYDYYLQLPDQALTWYLEYLKVAPEPDVTPDLAPQHIPMKEYAKNRVTQISENKSRRHEKQAQ